jgi:hypothetical protein
MRPYIEAIIGQPRIIMLHDNVTGQGNTATFEVKAFRGIVILDLDLTGPLAQRSIVIQECPVVCPTAIGGGNQRGTSDFIYAPARLRKIR